MGKSLTEEETVALCLACQSGDRSAEAILLRAHGGLARHVLGRFRAPRCVDLDDLLQEGRMALVRAFRAFDPSRGCRFVSYAARAVWAAYERYCDTACRDRRHASDPDALAVLGALPSRADRPDPYAVPEWALESLGELERELLADVVLRRLSYARAAREHGLESPRRARQVCEWVLARLFRSTASERLDDRAVEVVFRGLCGWLEGMELVRLALLPGGPDGGKGQVREARAG